MTATGFRLGLDVDMAPRLPVALTSIAFLIFYWVYLRRLFGERVAILRIHTSRKLRRLDGVQPRGGNGPSDVGVLRRVDVIGVDGSHCCAVSCWAWLFWPRAWSLWYCFCRSGLVFSLAPAAASPRS